MYSMENLLKTRKVGSPHTQEQVGAVTRVTGAMEQVLNPVERVGSFHSHKTLVIDVEKAEKTQECKALDAVCQGCSTKGHFEKVCLKSKCSTNSLEVPQASTSTTGADDPLYFNDDGEPVFAHMVSVLHLNKHLIKFPISLDYGTLRSRSRNKMENSTDSTKHSKCSTFLLKADTGADVNLMNKQTFHQLFGGAKAKDLIQLTPIRMENYGNTAVKVLGRFHVFL